MKCSFHNIIQQCEKKNDKKEEEKEVADIYKKINQNWTKKEG